MVDKQRLRRICARLGFIILLAISGTWFHSIYHQWMTGQALFDEPSTQRDLFLSLMDQARIMRPVLNRASEISFAELCESVCNTASFMAFRRQDNVEDLHASYLYYYFAYGDLARHGSQTNGHHWGTHSTNTVTLKND